MYFQAFAKILNKIKYFKTCLKYTKYFTDLYYNLCNKNFDDYK